MADLSALSDSDLAAIAAGDMSKVSDNALAYISADPSEHETMKKRMGLGLGPRPAEPVSEYSPMEEAALGSIVAPQALGQAMSAAPGLLARVPGLVSSGAGLASAVAKDAYPAFKKGLGYATAYGAYHKLKGLLGGDH